MHAMQAGSFYRMKRPTIGIYSDSIQRITVPPGAYVKIIKPKGTFVEADWDGRHMLIFAIDISERAELVQVASAGASVDGNGSSPLETNIAEHGC